VPTPHRLLRAGRGDSPRARRPRHRACPDVLDGHGDLTGSSVRFGESGTGCPHRWKPPPMTSWLSRWTGRATSSRRTWTWTATASARHPTRPGGLLLVRVISLLGRARWARQRPSGLWLRSADLHDQRDDIVFDFPGPTGRGSGCQACPREPRRPSPTAAPAPSRYRRRCRCPGVRPARRCTAAHAPPARGPLVVDQRPGAHVQAGRFPRAPWWCRRRGARWEVGARHTPIASTRRRTGWAAGERAPSSRSSPSRRRCHGP